MRLSFSYFEFESLSWENLFPGGVIFFLLIEKYTCL